MCGPAFEYTREDFLNDASPEEWAAWEKNAAELEVPLDLGKWHTPPCVDPPSRVLYFCRSELNHV